MTVMENQRLGFLRPVWQLSQQVLEGSSSVTEPMLRGKINLTKRLPMGAMLTDFSRRTWLASCIQISGDKHRIIAKSPVSPDFISDGPWTSPLAGDDGLPVPHHGDGFERAGAETLGLDGILALQMGKQPQHAQTANGLVNVGRVHAWKPVQRINKQACILNQEHRRRAWSVVFGLFDFRHGNGVKVAGLGFNHGVCINLQLTHIVPKRGEMMDGFLYFPCVAGQEPNDVVHGCWKRTGPMTLPPNLDSGPVFLKYLENKRAAATTMVSDVVLVAVGGAVGAVLRWYVAESMASEPFPWATLMVNLVGSVLLGASTALLAANVLTEQQALLLGVGVLGGFTTLSTFSMETALLMDEGRWGTVATYIGLTGIAAPLLALLSWKGTAQLLS